MIRYMRRATLRCTPEYGQVSQAYSRMRDYFNKRFPETHFDLFVDACGSIQTVYIMADFPDLAAWEHWWNTHQADPEYVAAMMPPGTMDKAPAGSSFIVDGSDNITLLRTW
jgi:hypothetical protein